MQANDAKAQSPRTAATTRPAIRKNNQPFSQFAISMQPVVSTWAWKLFSNGQNSQAEGEKRADGRFGYKGKASHFSDASVPNETASTGGHVPGIKQVKVGVGV